MTTHTQHTPGPWTAKIDRAWNSVIGPDKRVVATLLVQSIRPSEERRANAHFIVQAANCHDELVAALKDIIEECLNPKLPYGIRIVEIARAAIAKAEAQP